MRSDLYVNLAPGITLAKGKEWFFDRTVVERACDAATRKMLAIAGRSVQIEAQHSMRYVNDLGTQRRQLAAGRRKSLRSVASSAPGQPPRAHRSHPYLRKFLYFAYDSARGTAVIGPVGFTNSQVPAVLEFGGTVTIRNPLARTYKLGDWGPIRSADAVGTVICGIKVPDAVYVDLKSPAMVRRANQLNLELFGPPRRQVTIYPRPYMGPALEKVSPRLPEIWAKCLRS